MNGLDWTLDVLALDPARRTRAALHGFSSASAAVRKSTNFSGVSFFREDIVCSRVGKRGWGDTEREGERGRERERGDRVCRQS